MTSIIRVALLSKKNYDIRSKLKFRSGMATAKWSQTVSAALSLAFKERSTLHAMLASFPGEADDISTRVDAESPAVA